MEFHDNGCAVAFKFHVLREMDDEKKSAMRSQEILRGVLQVRGTIKIVAVAGIFHPDLQNAAGAVVVYLQAHVFFRRGQTTVFEGVERGFAHRQHDVVFCRFTEFRKREFQIAPPSSFERVDLAALIAAISIHDERLK